MVTLKLLFVLIGSCVAYRTSGLNSYTLTSEPLSPLEGKDDERVAPQGVLRSNVADSDDLQLFNKHKRAVLKSILNGILLKERMGTKGRLVKGASGVHSSHLNAPETNTASANIISHNYNPSHVSNTNQPALCPSPSNFVQTESFSSNNEATIKPCLAYGGSFTNNPNVLHSIIRQKFQHIPLTSTTNFKLPSGHLNPYVNIQNYNTLPSDAPFINTNTPTEVSSDIPESHSFIPLNIPKYSVDSLMQQNIPQVKKCELVNSESGSLNFESPEEINEPSFDVIPEPPAYFPLNSPEVFVGALSTSNNVQNIHLDCDAQKYDDSHIHHSSPDNILIEQDISNDFIDNTDSENSLPCLQTPHETFIENLPISIPEAPALLPLNPPSISFNSIDTTFDDVITKDNVTSIDSANVELSDPAPCSQSYTPSITTTDDILSDFSETPTPTSSNVEIPHPPAYIPLNPPEIHSSPVYDLNVEDIYNVESDNSEPSGLSCSQNTVEPTENVLYIIPEPPGLLPLNPPDVSLYPTYLDDEKNKEELGFDLSNAVLSELAYYPSSFKEPTEDIPSIVLETLAPTLSHSNDNAIIPDPPAYIPLNPEVSYISIPEDKNINYNILDDKKTPCPQQLSITETTETAPIILHEDITDVPFETETPLSYPTAIIPDPPSYIPLDPPGTTFNVAIDKDAYISPDNHEHIPCSQSHSPVTELSYNLPLVATEDTKSVVIPNPPSYIPLNPPHILNANKIQKEIPSLALGEQESKDCLSHQTPNTEIIEKLSIASQPEVLNSFSSNEPKPTNKPELILQSPDVSKGNVPYACSDDSEGSTFIPCQQSSRIESLQNIPVSFPEAPINSPIHLSFSIKQQISLPNILHDSHVLPLSEHKTEKGQDYKSQKSTADTYSSNEALAEDIGTGYAEQQVTNNFNPAIAIGDKQIQGSVSQVFTSLNQVNILNKEANSKLSELPPCAPEAPADEGVMTTFFESKKCKSNKQESTLTFEKFPQPAQHLRKRKVWMKKSLTPGAENSQPLLIKKTKKVRILRQ